MHRFKGAQDLLRPFLIAHPKNGAVLRKLEQQRRIEHLILLRELEQRILERSAEMSGAYLGCEGVVASAVPADLYAHGGAPVHDHATNDSSSMGH